MTASPSQSTYSLSAWPTGSRVTRPGPGMTRMVTHITPAATTAASTIAGERRSMRRPCGDGSSAAATANTATKATRYATGEA